MDDVTLAVRVKHDSADSGGGSSIEVGDRAAPQLLGSRLLRWLPRPGAHADRQPPLYVAIGTDRSTGDCLGPLAGTLMRGRGMPDTCVKGTLDRPVHAANLDEVVDDLRGTADSRFIIAIDACLGPADNVGTIALGQGPLKPGAGVNKTLPQIGDLHITATVNVGGFMEYCVLQNTRLSLVMRMAEAIAGGLLWAHRRRYDLLPTGGRSSSRTVGDGHRQSRELVAPSRQAEDG